MDLYLIMNRLTLITWTSSANYIFGEMLLLDIGSPLVYQTKPIVILLKTADSLCVARAHTALNVLCLTDLYCARVANKFRKPERISINEKMCLLKEVDMNVGSQKSIVQKFGISTSVLS